MICLRDVNKYFGHVQALNNINFTANRGEICGLLGHNGAGKTTLLKLITGFIPLCSGEIQVLDYILTPFKKEDLLLIREKVAYLPENNPLYSDLKVIEYLNFRGELKGLRGTKLKSNLEKVIDLFKLDDFCYKRIFALSRGMKQRVGLADTLIHEPEVILLDESTAGLDPEQVLHFRQLLRELKKDRTIILSSHLLFEVEQVCDRVVVMHHGEVLLEDKTCNLSEKAEKNTVELELKGKQLHYQKDLCQMPGVSEVKAVEKSESTYFEIKLTSSLEEVRENIFIDVVKKELVLFALNYKPINLEQIFFAYMQEKRSIKEVE
ncbi:ABC transporter ATP-binding protein [Candidatus Riflebacteria bacterium]